MGSGVLTEVLRATKETVANGWTNADGRLTPDPVPGVLEARVAPSSAARALQVFRDVACMAEEVGMLVAPVGGGRHHRAGVGIGQGPAVTPLRIEEQQSRVPIEEIDLQQYLAQRPVLALYEDEILKRGWVSEQMGDSAWCFLGGGIDLRKA